MIRNTPPPLSQLEAVLKLEFRDKSLLQRAFIHRSFLNELLEEQEELVDNERLEFLGDAVLSYVVSERLYALFPIKDEGELTNLRSALVRRETLARLASDLRLGDYLNLGHGEEESGGRTRPATLCATFEALVGALYLDQGTEAVKQMVFSMLAEDLARLQAESHTKDPKSRLQEWVQANLNFTPRYKVAQAVGPDHAKHFMMLVQVNGQPRGVGDGRSKQEAAQKAAAMALFGYGQPASEFPFDPALAAQFGVVTDAANAEPAPGFELDSSLPPAA